MDKDLHNDIGDLFYDGIEPMSEMPRKQVWDNLAQQLDKTDAEHYKKKFITARRLSLLLLLLLIGFATFTTIYFTSLKNENDEGKNLTSNKQSGGNTNNSSNGTIDNRDNQASAQVGDSRDADPQSMVNNTKEGEVIADNLNKTRSINIVKDDRIKAKENLVNHNNTADKNEPIVVNKKVDGNKADETKRNTTKVATSMKYETHDLKTGIDANNESALINKHQDLSSPIKSNLPQTIVKEKDLVKNEEIIQSNTSGIKVKDSSTSIGQNKTIAKATKKKAPVSSRFSLTAYFAPEFAGYILKDDELNQHDNKQIIEKREKADPSISTGVLLGYSLNNRFTIQSGVTYSSTKISIDASKIYAEATYAGDIKYRFNTSSGYSYILPSISASPAIGDSLVTRISEHLLHQIVVPVMAKYKFGTKKLTVNAGAGIAFNFLTKATLGTELVNSQNQEVESFTKLDGLKKVSYSLLLSPELQYSISKKWSLSAMPYLKYALSSVNKRSVVKTYPYNVGLGVGVVYRF